MSETSIPRERRAEAPGLAFKAFAILALMMATIAPLSSTWMTNTSRNQQGATVTPDNQPENARTPAPQSPAGEVWSYATGGRIYSSPVVADLFGDGKLEVIVGSEDNATYCLNGTTGSKLWSYATGDRIYSSPVVADFFGDGKKEVIVGSVDYSVYCLNGTTGSKLWSFAAENRVSVAVVADLFGDGNPEVIVGSWDHSVYCLNGTTGRKLWNYTTGGIIWHSPVVDDVIGDGKLEVVVGSDDGNVYCLNGMNGSRLWSCLTASDMYNSPVVADLIGNGKKEVIAQSIVGIYCINGTIGSKLWNNGVAINSENSPPVVANLVGDSKLEVIVHAVSVQDGSVVYCLNGTTGTEVWNFTTGPQLFFSYDSLTAVADLFGNGKLEVVVGSTNLTLYCLDGTSGGKLWSFRTGGYVVSSPVVAKLLGSSEKQVIALSSDGSIYILDGMTGSAIRNYTEVGYDPTSPVLTDIGGDDEQEMIVGTKDDSVYCLSLDITPPATVTDLTASSVDDTSIVLTWTAPGDNGMTRNATGYVVKYSKAGSVNGANWTLATTYDQSWTPAKNGTTETHVVTGLTPKTTYWFAVRACDEASNYGGLSNSPSATTTGVGTIIIFGGLVAASIAIDVIAVVLTKRKKPRRDYSNT